MACYIDISQLIENPDLDIHVKINFPLPGQTDNSFKTANVCSVLCELSIKNDTLLVKAQAKVTINTACTHCNKAIKNPVKADFCETVKLDSILVANGRLDMGPMVMDAVYLEIPPRTLCNDACEGVCEKCGTNLNYSSCFCSSESLLDRWLPFKKLKFKNIFIGEV